MDPLSRREGFHANGRKSHTPCPTHFMGPDKREIFAWTKSCGSRDAPFLHLHGPGDDM